MRIRRPKLRTMTHALSLGVFIAFKGTNFYILLNMLTNSRSENSIIKITLDHT